MGAQLSHRAPAIAIVSGKGGTCKSTVLTGLAVELALLGKRVLLVDLDHSGTSTRSLLAPHNPTVLLRKAPRIPDKLTVRALLTRPHVAVADLARPVDLTRDGVFRELDRPRSDAQLLTHNGPERGRRPGQGALDVVPAADRDPGAIESGIARRAAREGGDPRLVLAAALDQARMDYDLILIDTVMGGLVWDNALYAADRVIVPLDASEPTHTALHQQRRNRGFVEEVRREREARGMPPLDLLGVLLVRVRGLADRAAAATDPSALRQALDDPVFETIVPWVEDPYLSSAAPIQLRDPGHPLSEAFHGFALAVLERESRATPRP